MRRYWIPTVAWYVLICLPFDILPMHRLFVTSCTMGGSSTNGPQSGHRVGAVSESGAAAGSSQHEMMEAWTRQCGSCLTRWLLLHDHSLEQDPLHEFISLISSLQCSLLKRGGWRRERNCSMECGDTIDTAAAFRASEICPLVQALLGRGSISNASRPSLIGSLTQALSMFCMVEERGGTQIG